MRRQASLSGACGQLDETRAGRLPRLRCRRAAARPRRASRRAGCRRWRAFSRAGVTPSSNPSRPVSTTRAGRRWSRATTSRDTGGCSTACSCRARTRSSTSPRAPSPAPFWRYISDAGLRSTVVSVYSAAPLPSFRGTQVQGWGSIDPYFAKFAEASFDPPEVEQLLRRAVGRRQALYRVNPPRTDSQVRGYRDRLLKSVEEQTRGLEALIDETEWDFFFGSFAEPHQAGHLLWHLTDPEHPDYDPNASPDLHDALFAIYRAVDAGLGRLIRVCLRNAGTSSSPRTGWGRSTSRIRSSCCSSRGLVHPPAGRIRRRLPRAIRQAVWSFGRRVVPVRSRVRRSSPGPGPGATSALRSPSRTSTGRAHEALPAPQRHDLVRARSTSPDGSRRASSDPGRGVRPPLRRALCGSRRGDGRRHGWLGGRARRAHERPHRRPRRGSFPTSASSGRTGSSSAGSSCPGTGRWTLLEPMIERGSIGTSGSCSARARGSRPTRKKEEETCSTSRRRRSRFSVSTSRPSCPGRPIAAFT